MYDFIFMFFELAKNIKKQLDIKDFKLIIREDGSGTIKDLKNKVLYDFDTLSEFINRFELDIKKG